MLKDRPPVSKGFLCSLADRSYTKQYQLGSRCLYEDRPRTRPRIPLVVSFACSAKQTTDLPVGLTAEMYKSKQPDFSMRGDYRRVIARPGDLQWSVRQYGEATEQLVASDLDQLSGRTLQPTSGELVFYLPNSSMPELTHSGPLKALELSFNLPTSSYATMALREVIGDLLEDDEDEEA